jgi:hypothetical protein
MRLTRQATPLGFDSISRGGATINRSPLWGSCLARTRAGQPNQARQPRQLACCEPAARRGWAVR